MNDDIFKIKPTKTAIIEDDEQFIIHSQSEIIQKLRMLEKSRSMVTVYFDEGKQFLLTAIIGVMAEKKMVILDYGQDETTNQALLAANEIVFKAQRNGVSTRFKAHAVIKARYQDQSVFACPIPNELLWVQRRDTYRVRIPIKTVATCLIHQDQRKATPYRIHDISVGGISLEDTENSTHFALGATFDKCEITLPEHGTGIVSLEVRSLAPVNPDNPALIGRKIGCRLYDMRSDMDAMIQRFIHAIDTERRRLEEN